MSGDGTRRSRRTVLAALGIGVTGFAGCGTQPGEVDTRPRTTRSDTATTGAPTETATTADTATSAAEPTATTEEPTTESETDTETETSEPDAVTRMEEQIASVEFDGEYVDTHAHWQAGEDAVVSAYAQKMDEYDIGATALFTPSRMAASSYESFLRTVTDPGVDYLPFMSAPPPGTNLPAELDALYDDTAPAFWGIGEWKPQGSTVRDFDGAQLTRLWELAAEIDVPVMYHPFPEQEGQVERALAANPDTTFLLHGHQMLSYGQDRPGLGPTLPRLLSEYDNLYWTMDVASITAGSLVTFRNAQAFLDWWAENAAEHRGYYSQFLTELLEVAPSRVVWGTDVAWEWNLEDAVFERVMSFTERALEDVPAEHHAAFKRENARELFGI